ncbi:MAG TPA: hypothetical protein VGN73_00180 [Gemmatimonadaceae bacterium]|jgi:hypothetical protein|nr:hypothetical protein [Gemmatimonadaceae bacterium]
MQNWVRRIRGAIGMGFTWAAAWAVAGMAPRWVFGINADAPFPLIFGVLGFTAGVAFSAVLALTERGRTLDQMSLPRFAGWGAVGGFLLSALFARAASLGLGDVLVVAPTFALASAVCASGSLAMARRAERRDLLDSRGETFEAALTAHEKRKLPGNGD